MMANSSVSSSSKIFVAPGRINLIGDHTDYNGGFALPAAINLKTTVEMEPRVDARLFVRADNAGTEIDVALDAIETERHGDWRDYVCGVAWSLASCGVNLRGANLIVSSDIPLGSGLSSSAALEVSVALALLSRAAVELDLREIALACQRAENVFVGVRCGIMDQLTSCVGRQGSALLLDCRSLEIDYLSIPNHVRLAVCNSMIKHSLASGEYNRRRQECEDSVAIIAQSLPHITQLRDVTLTQLERFRNELGPTAFRRCRHVITENQRTVAAATALRNNDLTTFGALMNDSHKSLRDDYEVSCAELDILVELAGAQVGVYGSRMTGGGFGGCTITLVEADRVERFETEVRAGYARRAGRQCEIYICMASDGAREIAGIQ